MNELFPIFEKLKTHTELSTYGTVTVLYHLIEFGSFLLVHYYYGAVQYCSGAYDLRCFK
jgi:hypothetical protein